VNVFTLVTSLLFVAAGVLSLATGRDATTGGGAVLFFGGCALVAAWDLWEQRRQRRGLDQPPPLVPAFGHEQVVIRPRRTECLVYFLGSAGFAGGGIFLILLKGPQLVLWLGVAFFGLGSLVFLWQLLDPRPRLVINSQGVYDRTNGAGWIDWSDIRAAWVASVMGHDFLCLEVLDPEKYLGRMSRWRRLVGRINRGAGFTELYLNLSGVAVRTDQVLRGIEEHLRNRRAATACPGEEGGHRSSVRNRVSGRRKNLYG
jgi:hypothetical protein